MRAGPRPMGWERVRQRILQAKKPTPWERLKAEERAMGMRLSLGQQAPYEAKPFINLPWPS